MKNISYTMKISYRNIIALLLLALAPLFLWAQEEDNQQKNKLGFKTIRSHKKKDTLPFTIKDYKIITHLKDTITVDTTLTIYKYYKHNAVQKDMFGKMPFSNKGQTYNALTYDFTKADYLPSMGANAKKTLYLTPQEINYYHLPTPMTEFTYKTGFEQGQVLNTLFSVNLSPQLNIFMAYKGLRSLGNYQNILASNGNFRFGFSYLSPNKKYTAFAHYAGHDIYNNENGGIATPEQFESGDTQFKNRAVLDVHFTDAQSTRESKRYFLSHEYAFLNHTDTLLTNKQIRLRHQFLYETEYYQFEQATAQKKYFGDSYVVAELNDKARLKKMINTLGTELELPYLGRTFLSANAYHYNYFFRNAYYTSGVLQPHQIKDTDLSLGAQWHKRIGGFAIDAQAEQTLVGKITGTHLNGKLSYAFNTLNKIQAGIDLQSAMPDFNFLLYQSDYKNYNWYHFDDFGKQNTQTLFAEVNTQWGNAQASLSNINNYTYFEVQEPITGIRSQSVPKQFTGDIQYFKLKLQREFTLGKFSLENTLLFQKVVQGEPILNVPTFVTRNSLYFSTHLFKKAMYLQTGLGFNYFSSYYANRYNPLLAEFEVQSSQKTGGFPMFDFFFNAKVRTMRIFFTIEHFNPILMDRIFDTNPYRYYSAPDYPYRDLTIRFGIVWNIFT